MSSLALSFDHRFKPATRPGLRPLLLLHGTGGNETDLLPLGALVSSGAALLSPRGSAFRLGGTPVLILSGTRDPIVPAANAARLARMLTQAGADARHEPLPTGHGLTQDDVVPTGAWLR